MLINPINWLLEPSEIKYLVRTSSNNGPTNHQRSVLSKMINAYDMPSMTDSNSIVLEGVSGSSNPMLSIIEDHPSSDFIVADFDRVLKSLDVKANSRLHSQAQENEVRIFSTVENFKGLRLVLKALPTPQAVDAITRFLSLRMSSSLSVDSVDRSGVSDLVEERLPDVRALVAQFCSKDQRLLALSSALGFLINLALKDFYRDSFAYRLPRERFRSAWVLRSLDVKHPSFSNTDLVVYANKYPSVAIKTSQEVSRMGASEAYGLASAFKHGKFEPHLPSVLKKIRPSLESTTIKDLTKFELSLLKTKIEGFKGLRKFQSQVLKDLQTSKHVSCQIVAGGGKSLLFMIPALRGQKVLVICPYLRLITNLSKSSQKILGKKRVGVLSGQVTYSKKLETIKSFTEGPMNLLFATPEQFNPDKPQSLKIIKKIRSKVDLLVLDEAHHSALDGSEFRVRYHHSNLHQLWRKLKKPQCLFLSASLTKKSKKALFKIVGTEPTIVKGPLIRNNVHLETRKFEGLKAQEIKMAWVCLMVKNMKERLGFNKVIVYVNSPQRVMQMMEQIKGVGIRKVYGVHGRKEKKGLLTAKEIEDNQRKFEQGKGGVMIATSAYSEGIDVDVQGVIVADLPINVETLYQMILRAGHQGQKGLAFVCDDQKARDFVRYGLLQNDLKKLERFERAYAFLSRKNNLWDGLTKRFK